MKAISYFIASGAISGWLQDDRIFDRSWFADDMEFITVADSTPIDRDQQYVAGSPPTVTARPTPACTLDKTTITANGTDTATLSSIPIGASVTVTDGNGTTTYTATDSTLEITADDPGAITVTVTPAFPYIPLTVTVTAT
jgi:capsular polysaccharide biosynthesis protein